MNTIGPVDARRNDCHIVHVSNLLQGLQGLHIAGVNYQVYADSAYMVRSDINWVNYLNNQLYVCRQVTPNLVGPIPHLLAPTGSPAAALNAIMADVRTCTSEWWYGVITNTFQALDFVRWQRQYLTVPALQYAVGMLFVNCRTCMNMGNRISHYFDCAPPTLDSYLNGVFTPPL